MKKPALITKRRSEMFMDLLCPMLCGTVCMLSGSMFRSRTSNGMVRPAMNSDCAIVRNTKEVSKPEAPDKTLGIQTVAKPQELSLIHISEPTRPY